MSPRFQLGQRVRIAARDPEVHNRTPHYARGRVGTVARICKAFGQPETLAYGGDGEPAQPIYRVRIAQRDLWEQYGGGADDMLEIEIFEHWLEPVEST